MSADNLSIASVLRMLLKFGKLTMQLDSTTNLRYQSSDSVREFASLFLKDVTGENVVEDRMKFFET